MADRLVLSADRFKYWAIDFVRNELVIVTADGQRYTEVLSTPSWPNNQVAQSVFDWERWWVFSTTVRGDALVSEAYSPTNAGPRRPAVYLDQNHWSTVARAMVDPNHVTNINELAAALRIIELAMDGGIVLPLSSSHFVETGPLYGDRRYNLGLAMATLSGGWELRHPTAVWDNEVAVILARYAGAPLPAFSELPVVTTEPQAFLANGVRAYELESDWELFKLVLSEPSIALSCLIDTTPEPKIVPSAWAKRNQEITDYFAGEALSNGDRRKQAAGFFWTDSIQVVASAATRVGVSPNSFLQDPKALVQQLDSTPFLSNLSALFRLRHLDRNTRWKDNDLIDMMALSCAAAYCEYVAAERHTGTQLRQLIKGRGVPPNTFLTLAELVKALDRDGVKTAAEK
jgi:hypothetical protein